MGGVGRLRGGVGLPDVRVIGGKAGGAEEAGERGGWRCYGHCCCHFVVMLQRWDGWKKTRENLVTVMVTRCDGTQNSSLNGDTVGVGLFVWREKCE